MEPRWACGNAGVAPISNGTRARMKASILDPDDQEASLRLPEQGELQDGDLLPLRRPRSLPGKRDPHESRMNHFFVVEALEVR